MYFPTTQWTLLARASLHGESGARQALEELCHRYWMPLNGFIRARGYSEAEAADLTQEFLLHLLEHSTWKRADRHIGRFRTFLLGALTRFLADEYDRRRAQKRGGGAAHLSLEEDMPELAGPAEPGEVWFDREWALVVLENALRALSQEWQQAGDSPRWEVLARFLPGAVVPLTYEAAAARLGMSIPALKSELHRLRRRFRLLVRLELANTVSAPHELDAELEHLQRVLMDRGNNWGADLKPPVVLP